MIEVAITFYHTFTTLQCRILWWSFFCSIYCNYYLIGQTYQPPVLSWGDKIYLHICLSGYLPYLIFCRGDSLLFHIFSNNFWHLGTEQFILLCRRWVYHRNIWWGFPFFSTSPLSPFQCDVILIPLVIFIHNSEVYCL